MLRKMEKEAGTADVERPAVVMGEKKRYGEALACGLSGQFPSCLTGSSIVAPVTDFSEAVGYFLKK